MSPRNRAGRPSPETAGVSTDELDALRAAVEHDLPAYLADLRALVGIDCGTYTKSGVDEVGRTVAARLERLGAGVERIASEALGDTLVASWSGAAGLRVLLIGHLDTVYEPGTVAARPFGVEGALARAPGVSDMKGGLLAGVYAVAAVRRVAGGLPFGRLAYVLNPDEEVGSPESSAVIRREAAEADACLVLESARENGDIVSARKGMRDIRLTVRGRAAHAGVEPERGRSAIVEAAHQTLALAALTGRWPGVTCNVGRIAGGSRPNVVADACTLELDLRSLGRADLEAAEAAVREIAAATTVPDTTVEVEVLSGHQPMERRAGTARLAEHASALAGALGFEIGEAATGGASDANTTAGLGVPTLDGLGPIGGNDHSPREWLDLDSVVPRTTLLAALLLAIARDGALPRLRGA